MKKIASVVLSLFIVLSLCAAPVAFATEEPAGTDVDNPAGIEDIQDEDAGSNTIYDETNVVETDPIPDEEEPPEDTDLLDNDSDIYGNDSYDAENNAQLAGAEYISNEIIIKFKEPGQVPGKEKQLQHEIEKVEKVGFVEGLGVYVVKVDDLGKNPNAVLNRFKNNKYIESVEPNYIGKNDVVPNDPNYSAMALALTILNAQAGWDIISGASGPIVAVVDTGVAIHPDLPPLLPGYSAVAGLSPNNDKDGHGTSVAGTIGAIGNNKIGGAGINWNASIMPVKVDDGNSTFSAANFAKGIMWAADNGARIISTSISFTTDNTTIKSAIDYAYSKGCAIFSSAGNDGKNGLNYPARYSNVMAVGGSGNGSARAAVSNYGIGMGVLANTSYNTTTAAGGYAIMSGTSFSTPQVAGLASLILGINPNLTNEQVYDLIKKGAKGGGNYLNDEQGYGFIDIGKTLKLTLETVGAAPAAANEPEPVIPETPPEPRTAPTITMNGFTSLTLENGQAYNEMGYSAKDCKGIDLTSSVKVTNNVNIFTAGLYSITYKVEDSTGLTATATRSVTVNAKPAAPPPKQAPKITINGSNPIVLHQTSSTPYKEQGAKAVDYDGTDLSSQVKITGSVNRTVAGTYKLTYSITGKDGLTATATRDVRILAPTEKKDPRVKYGLSGQAKEGAKVSHTGITSSALGFMDLTVSSIDKNMTISVQLIDTATKKAVLTDTFTAAGKKQYNIDQGKYELAVTVTKANGNSKYAIDLLMPETKGVTIYDSAEVPLAGLPSIAPIGSNPIILHIGGTPYTEQGARASDFLGEDISDKVEIEGAPDTSKAGSYTITYKVTGATGKSAVATREVRVLAPNIFGVFEDEEVPLAAPAQEAVSDTSSVFFYLTIVEAIAIIGLAAALIIVLSRRKIAASLKRKDEE